MDDIKRIKEIILLVEADEHHFDSMKGKDFDKYYNSVGKLDYLRNQNKERERENLGQSVNFNVDNDKHSISSNTFTDPKIKKAVLEIFKAIDGYFHSKKMPDPLKSVTIKNGVEVIFKGNEESSDKKHFILIYYEGSLVFDDDTKTILKEITISFRGRIKDKDVDDLVNNVLTPLSRTHRYKPTNRGRSLFIEF
jgi:hypothetical protein